MLEALEATRPIATIQTITTEDVKQVILAACSRTGGMVIEMSANCGKPFARNITLKDQCPEVVTFTGDGRVGFRIDNHSYITPDPRSGAKFKEWVVEASRQISLDNIQYGNPTLGIKFKCCS